MCKMPNNQHEAFTAIEFAVINNIATFQEENDLQGLSETLDELFSGYLDSELCEADPTAKVERFQDYLKLKALLRIIE